jgi:hypothetical protein
MAIGKRSKTAEGNAALYKSSRRWEANRKRKLERALKEQPTNEQIKIALKNIVYRRKTPTNREWSASWIRTAKLIKAFTGKFDKAIMNSNPKVASEALSSSHKNIPYTPVVGRDKSMFSILCRANMNSGRT